MTEPLDRLYRAVVAAKTADPAVSRTARLLRSGRGKMAKKLAEEAVEVVIDAMNGHNEAVVRESADLLYHLLVLWAAAGASRLVEAQPRLLTTSNASAGSAPCAPVSVRSGMTFV